MRAYIWYDLDYVTDNYHDNGGVLVIAKSPTRAKELIPRKGDAPPVTSAPDKSWALVGAPMEEVIVFPNAGCC